MSPRGTPMGYGPWGCGTPEGHAGESLGPWGHPRPPGTSQGPWALGPGSYDPSLAPWVHGPMAHGPMGPTNGSLARRPSLGNERSPARRPSLGNERSVYLWFLLINPCPTCAGYLYAGYSCAGMAMRWLCTGLTKTSNRRIQINAQ